LISCPPGVTITVGRLPHCSRRCALGVEIAGIGIARTPGLTKRREARVHAAFRSMRRFRDWRWVTSRTTLARRRPSHLRAYVNPTAARTRRRSLQDRFPSQGVRLGVFVLRSDRAQRDRNAALFEDRLHSALPSKQDMKPPVAPSGSLGSHLPERLPQALRLPSPLAVVVGRRRQADDAAGPSRFHCEPRPKLNHGRAKRGGPLSRLASLTSRPPYLAYQR